MAGKIGQLLDKVEEFYKAWLGQDGKPLDVGSVLGPWENSEDVVKFFRAQNHKIRIEGINAVYGFNLVCEQRTKGNLALKSREKKTLTKYLPKKRNCRHSIRLKPIEDGLFQVAKINSYHCNHKKASVIQVLTDTEEATLVSAFDCNAQPKQILSFIRENFDKEITYEQLRAIKRRRNKEIVEKQFEKLSKSAAPQSQIVGLINFLEDSDIPLVMIMNVIKEGQEVRKKVILKVPDENACYVPEEMGAHLSVIDRMRARKSIPLWSNRISLDWDSDIPNIVQQGPSCSENQINQDESQCRNSIGLSSRWDAIVDELGENEELQFFAIGFAEYEQLEAFCRFPEIIGIDTTCSSNGQNRPFGYITAIDSMGKTISGVTFFAINETRSSFLYIMGVIFPWLVGEATRAISAVISDGDNQIRDVCEFLISKSIIGTSQSTSFMLCYYHAIVQPLEKLRNCFAGMLEVLKYVRSFLRRMVNQCINDVLFQQQFEDLRQWIRTHKKLSASQQSCLLDFLVQIEMKKKYLVKAYRFHAVTMGTIANSRNEAEHTALKMDRRVNNKATLQVTAIASTQIHHQRLVESRVSAIKYSEKRPLLTTKERNIVQDKIAHLLDHFTRRAMDFVIKQMQLHSKYSVQRISEYSFRVHFNGGTENQENLGSSEDLKLPPFPKIPHELTVKNGRIYCDCGYAEMYLLPCKHMLAVKRGQIQREDLHLRWLIKWYSGELTIFKRVALIDHWGAFVPEGLMETYPIGEGNPVQNENIENDNDNSDELVLAKTRMSYNEMKSQCDDCFKSLISLAGNNEEFRRLGVETLERCVREFKQQVQNAMTAKVIAKEKNKIGDHPAVPQTGIATSKRQKASYEYMRDGKKTKAKGRKRKVEEEDAESDRIVDKISDSEETGEMEDLSDHGNSSSQEILITALSIGEEPEPYNSAPQGNKSLYQQYLNLENLGKRRRKLPESLQDYVQIE